MVDQTTIFLTGSSGYVAGALRRVASKDASFAIVSVARGAAPRFPASHEGASAVIVHAAWPGLASASADAPRASEESWRKYCAWSAELKRAAGDSGARFIGVGSGLEAYAGDLRMKEPYQSYAAKKADLKALLSDGDGPFSWIRLHFMFGPEERPARIVPAAIRACLTGETLTCGSLARRRRWLHVDDQARRILEFAKAPLDGEWDIAGQADISFRALLSLTEQATARPLRLVESKERTPDDEIETITPRRMAPNVPLDAGVKETLVERLRDYCELLASRDAGPPVKQQR